MLKIGIYFETSQKLGGAHQQNLQLIQIFEKKIAEKFDITYIVPDKNFEKFFKSTKTRVTIFKTNLIYRVELFLFKFQFFREIYKKLKLTNKFEKYLLQKNFDLILFNSPSEVSILLNKLNFVIMLLSMQHRTHGYFPEYKGNHDNDIRDIIIDNAVKKSFKIFVGALKDKLLLEKFYNLKTDKAIVQPYAFTLPKLFEKNKDSDFKEIYNKLKLPEGKDIFFYPAQFWAHKNHKYLIDVAEKLEEQKLDKIHFVFCGYDKGNKKYIDSLISKKKIDNFFTILNFIDDKSLISLYLNSFGVVMPSFVGHTTIPMYESFYFRKNIFYTKDLCDNSVKNYLTEINIKDPNSFIEEYKKIISNEELNKKKLDEAKLFIDNLNIDETIGENFLKTFKDYEFLSSSWK